MAEEQIVRQPVGRRECESNGSGTCLAQLGVGLLAIRFAIQPGNQHDRRGGIGEPNLAYQPNSVRHQRSAFRSVFDAALVANPIDHASHVRDNRRKIDIRKGDPAALDAVEPVFASRRVELNLGDMPEMALVATEGLPSRARVGEAPIE
jgi:hypothetical protein